MPRDQLYWVCQWRETKRHKWITMPWTASFGKHTAILQWRDFNCGGFTAKEPLGLARCVQCRIVIVEEP